MSDAEILANRQQMAALIDRRRTLEAQIAGVNLEIAMALGERDDARYWQHVMYGLIEARKASAPEGLPA